MHTVRFGNLLDHKNQNETSLDYCKAAEVNLEHLRTKVSLGVVFTSLLIRGF